MPLLPSPSALVPTRSSGVGDLPHSCTCGAFPFHGDVYTSILGHGEATFPEGVEEAEDEESYAAPHRVSSYHYPHRREALPGRTTGQSNTLVSSPPPVILPQAPPSTTSATTHATPATAAASHPCVKDCQSDEDGGSADSDDKKEQHSRGDVSDEDEKGCPNAARPLARRLSMRERHLEMRSHTSPFQHPTGKKQSSSSSTTGSRHHTNPNTTHSGAATVRWSDRLQHKAHALDAHSRQRHPPRPMSNGSGAGNSSFASSLQLKRAAASFVEEEEALFWDLAHFTTSRGNCGKRGGGRHLSTPGAPSHTSSRRSSPRTRNNSFEQMSDEAASHCDRSIPHELWRFRRRGFQDCWCSMFFFFAMVLAMFACVIEVRTLELTPAMRHSMEERWGLCEVDFAALHVRRRMRHFISEEDEKAIRKRQMQRRADDRLSTPLPKANDDTFMAKTSPSSTGVSQKSRVKDAKAIRDENRFYKLVSKHVTFHSFEALVVGLDYSLCQRVPGSIGYIKNLYKEEKNHPQGDGKPQFVDRGSENYEDSSGDQAASEASDETFVLKDGTVIRWEALKELQDETEGIEGHGETAPERYWEKQGRSPSTERRVSTPLATVQNLQTSLSDERVSPDKGTKAAEGSMSSTAPRPRRPPLQKIMESHSPFLPLYAIEWQPLLIFELALFMSIPCAFFCFWLLVNFHAYLLPAIVLMSVLVSSMGGIAALLYYGNLFLSLVFLFLALVLAWWWWVYSAPRQALSSALLHFTGEIFFSAAGSDSTNEGASHHHPHPHHRPPHRSYRRFFYFSVTAALLHIVDLTMVTIALLPPFFRFVAGPEELRHYRDAGYILLLLLSNYWLLNVMRVMLEYLAAGVVLVLYYSGSRYRAPETPLKSFLSSALRTHLGALCFDALCLQPVEAVHRVLAFFAPLSEGGAKEKRGGRLARAREYWEMNVCTHVNAFALLHVVQYGCGYEEAASYTYELLQSGQQTTRAPEWADGDDGKNAGHNTSEERAFRGEAVDILLGSAHHHHREGKGEGRETEVASSSSRTSLPLPYSSTSATVAYDSKEKSTTTPVLPVAGGASSSTLLEDHGNGNAKKPKKVLPDSRGCQPSSHRSQGQEAHPLVYDLLYHLRRQLHQTSLHLTINTIAFLSSMCIALITWCALYLYLQRTHRLLMYSTYSQVEGDAGDLRQSSDWDIDISSVFVASVVFISSFCMHRYYFLLVFDAVWRALYLASLESPGGLACSFPRLLDTLCIVTKKQRIREWCRLLAAASPGQTKLIAPALVSDEDGGEERTISTATFLLSPEDSGEGSRPPASPSKTKGFGGWSRYGGVEESTAGIV